MLADEPQRLTSPILCGYYLAKQKTNLRVKSLIKCVEERMERNKNRRLRCLGECIEHAISSSAKALPECLEY